MILTSRDEFGEQFLEAEKFFQLRDARVMFADYDLLRRDFAPRLDGAERAEIDSFLVEHCGVISADQVRHCPEIPYRRARRLGYRPPYYGRAAVIPVDDPPRFIDVKGVGVQPGEIPRGEAYCTGLMMASEALTEILFEKLCAAALRHAGGQYEVVPTYALLDLGFPALTWKRRREPAVAIARRAHTRPRTQWDDEEPPGEVAVRVMRDIVLLLRRYGITTSRADYRIRRRRDALVLHARNEEFFFRGEEAERVAAATRYSGGTLIMDPVNVQFTTGIDSTPPRPCIFDFGSFGVCSRTDVPIFIASSAAEVDLVGEIIHLDDPRFPSADILQIPQRANTLGSRLAGEYMRGTRDGADVGQAIDRFVERCFSGGFA